ncbi:MAG: efflux RND transporter periplasmic adaptor subunit, partial [Flavobacteriales bacterium]|nr:efflux RND transporter periplasmic adaptor subunit [Flavobacteriales bacterium]
MKTASIMMALCALLFVGCNNKQGNEQSHDASGLEPLAYTIYSDKTELFVEFNPLVVGSTSSFAAHFTILGDNFLPLTAGKVKVSLVIGENGIRNSVDIANSPGVFLLALKPNISGTGKLIFDIETMDYTDQIVIENIIIYPNEQAALENQYVTASVDEITYFKQQAWKVEFASTPVLKAPFSDIIKTNGQILSAPGDEIMVTANASGSVMFSGNNTIVGSEVAVGTNLFTISG